MKYFSLSVLTFLALVSTVSPARAQSCCRVEGVVVAADGTPIAGADVQLTYPGLKTPRLEKTAANGRYAFTDVAIAVWAEVRVVSAGRAIAEGFTLVTSRVETLNIRILPEPATPATRADLNPYGGASAEVRGIVRDAVGWPIAGARVTLDGTPLDAVTDSAGRYSFGRVRSALRLSVAASAAAFESSTQEVTVPASGAADVDFALAPSKPAAEEVHGVVPDRGSLRLSAAALSTVPATPVENLEVGLHGRAPGETAVTIDGIPWYTTPRLMAGLVSPLAVNRAGAEVAPDALRVFDQAPASRVTGVADVGVTSVGGMVGARGARGLSLLIDAQRSWTGSLYDTVLDRFAPLDGESARTGTSSFARLNGRAGVSPAAGHRASVSFYRADDRGDFSHSVGLPTASTSISIPDPDELPADARLAIDDTQAWTGRGLRAAWLGQWTADFSTMASIARSRFEDARQETFSLMDASGVNEQNAIRNTTVRVAATLTPRFDHAIEFGVEHAAIDTDYGAQSVLASGSAPLLARDTATSISTIFAADVWRPLAGMTVTPGLRIVRTSLTDSSYVDPSVTASYAAAPHVVFSGAWSIAHDNVFRATREDRAQGDTGFWTAADGSLVPTIRTQQASAGLTVRNRTVLFDGRVFYREMRDLTLFAPRLLPQEILVSPDAAFYHGTGSAAGLELLVQHVVDRNTLRAGYSASRVEQTFETLESGTFPASFDRLHRLSVVNRTRIRGGWSAAASFFAASGLPYTPVSGVEQVWFASGGFAYQPVFETKNSDRLPASHQLDVSSEYVRRAGPLTATVGATVFNVYDRINPVSSEYSTTDTTAVATGRLLMRRAVNVFIKVSF